MVGVGARFFVFMAWTFAARDPAAAGAGELAVLIMVALIFTEEGGLGETA